MAITITWSDPNEIEMGHRVYKSPTYFDEHSLPTPLVDLGPDITQYEDINGNAGENWYIVSAYVNDIEVFSKPFIAGIGTTEIHDFFGDSSALATYRFDGNVNDKSGVYNLTPTNTGFNTGLFSDAVESLGDGALLVSSNNISSASLTLSAWVNLPTIRRSCIFSIGRFSYGTWIDNDGTLFYSMGSYNNNPITPADSGFTANTWFHICLTYNGSTNTANYYLNSVLIKSVNGTPAINEKLYIMGDAITSYPHQSLTTGSKVDQMRVFNRSLSSDEVVKLYNEV